MEYLEAGYKFKKHRKIFLSNYGEEFANSYFIDMCKSKNIAFELTAAELPFSNVLVKRHGLIIADIFRAGNNGQQPVITSHFLF